MGVMILRSPNVEAPAPAPTAEQRLTAEVIQMLRAGNRADPISQRLWLATTGAPDTRRVFTVPGLSNAAGPQKVSMFAYDWADLYVFFAETGPDTWHLIGMLDAKSLTRVSDEQRGSDRIEQAGYKRF